MVLAMDKEEIYGTKRKQMFPHPSLTPSVLCPVISETWSISCMIKGRGIMNSWRVLVLLFCFTNVAGLSVVDMISGNEMRRPWLSTGNGTLSTVQWTSMTSSSSFIAKGANSSVVLMSLPDIGGPYADANATAVRIRNVIYRNSTGRVTFEAKVCY